MNVVLGKYVRLFLMDGVADGRWIAELSNWTGKAYKIPRSMLKEGKILKGMELLMNKLCVSVVKNNG